MRPPLPWRPSKLRFEVEAQRSPGLRMSGFIPRHIEQPAQRQSKPAARKTSSSPSASACAFTCAEPGTTIALSVLATLRPSTISAASRRSPIREFVHEPMNTRSSGDLLHRRAGLEVHVLERSLLGSRAPASGTAPVTSTTWPGLVPQVTIGESAAASISTSVSKLAPSSVGQLAPARDRRVEVVRAPGPALDPLEGRLVGGDHPRAAAALDRHVADRHPVLHRQAGDRLARVLDRVADHAAGAEPADRRQDQVLGGDAAAELARVGDPHRLRALLHQALRGEHVLDLGGADPEGERAEGAVGGGVAVAADDRHPRLGQPELGADHVHDPLAVGAERVDRDAELLAVSLQRLDLDAGELVGDQLRGGGAVGGHVVVGGGERLVGPADRAALEPQPVEGLRRGDLVDEVQVDVDQPVADLVRVPDLVEQRLRPSL